jgi:hypothetical protein
MLQDIGADLRGDLLLRNHHAVFGGDGMNGIGGGGCVKGPALFLRACRQAAHENQRDASKYFKYLVSFDYEKGHQKSAASWSQSGIRKRKGLSQHGCYMASDAVSKTPPRDWSGTFQAWRWQFRTQAMSVCGFIHAAPPSLAGFSSIGPRSLTSR